jgi:Protein of unknown function (DUF3047)
MRISPLMLAGLFAATLFAPVLLLADDQTSVANFSEGDLSDWEEKSFEGNSLYRFVDAVKLDDAKNAQAGKVLHASTEGQASGLFKEVDIDLNKTPYLNWSWQVKNIFTGNDERSKEGDDYPARIYVVISGGVFFWNTKAINYVWSSNQDIGSEWPNAYTGNAKMIAVQTGNKKVGQWITERRNVRADLKRLFGEGLTHIDAVAVMVDGDNTGQAATAYFGDISFSAE